MEQEYRKYTSKSEADKAISSLKGILLGIQMDKEINNKEILELQKWSEKHYFLINRNPFKEFMQIINESTWNKTFDLSMADDMYWLCQKYETDYYYNAVTSDLQILHGICHGILSDAVIKDSEIIELEKWLEENIHLTSFYPYDEITCLIQSILKDGIIEEHERQILIAYFSDFVNLTNPETFKEVKDIASKMPVRGICTSNPDIYFDGKLFCLTGQFINGEKSFIESKIRECGSETKDHLTKKTDYLIIGGNGDPCWAFSCYGRKVEQAIKYRKEGIPISIIHEFDFWDYLQDYQS